MNSYQLYNANVPQNISIIINELINCISFLRVLKNYSIFNNLQKSEKIIFRFIFNNMVEKCLKLINVIDDYIEKNREYFINYICLYLIEEFNEIIM